MKGSKPMSIKIITWYLIICGIISIVMLPLVYNVPYIYKSAAALTLKVDSYTEVSFITGLSMLISGILIYKRKNAGAKIYAFMIPIALLTMVFIYNTKSIVFSGFVMYFIIMYFLFNKTGKSYFSNEYIENPINDDSLISVDEDQPKKKNIGRRVIGCILFMIGDYFFCTYVTILLPMIFSIGDGVTILAVASLFLIVFFLALMFIIAGVFIWGRHQWKELMVVGLLIVGIIVIMGGIGIMIGADIPQMQPTETKVMELSMERGMLIAGVIHITVAAAFSVKFKNKVRSLLWRKSKENK